MSYASSAPDPRLGSALDRWLDKRTGARLACPGYLAEMAVRNGERLGIGVKFVFIDAEWQVHMQTRRGTVAAAPMIAEQTCLRCDGSHVVRPPAVDAGVPCRSCADSVSLERAWRNSLSELGLMSDDGEAKEQVQLHMDPGVKTTTITKTWNVT